MLVKIKVNGKLIQDDVQPQTLLLDWLRDHGCYSVKRGCDTANCGIMYSVGRWNANSFL